MGIKHGLGRFALELIVGLAVIVAAGVLTTAKGGSRDAAIVGLVVLATIVGLLAEWPTARKNVAAFSRPLSIGLLGFATVLDLTPSGGSTGAIAACITFGVVYLLVVLWDFG